MRIDKDLLDEYSDNNHLISNTNCHDKY